MGCSFTSQQYYQQQYTMMQGISGAPGVSGNAQAPFDPFVMNQQQKDWYVQLFNTMVRESGCDDCVGHRSRWRGFSARGCRLLYAEWPAYECTSSHLPNV